MTDLILDAIREAVRDEIVLMRAELSALRAEIATTSARGLSPRDFAKASGLSLATVYRRLKDATLPYRRLGGRIIVSASALEPAPTCRLESPPVSNRREIEASVSGCRHHDAKRAR
ncbi:MAG: hypothetical protein JXP73_03300 [Deltaproteobacteria bacterium]|nr:hypothetical protein [Deltaproteobacteria bacterium]